MSELYCSGLYGAETRNDAAFPRLFRQLSGANQPRPTRGFRHDTQCKRRRLCKWWSALCASYFSKEAFSPQTVKLESVDLTTH